MSPVTFTVTAHGTMPLFYQWKKDGIAIAGATSPVFTIASPQLSDAGIYTVTVSNRKGSVTSRPVHLLVNGPGAVAPTITTQPQGSTVNVGTDVTLSVVATGTAPLVYQWHKNGIDIPGANGATLILFTPTESDSGNYTVTITNGAGFATSTAAAVTVNAIVVGPPPDPNLPVITAQPAQTSVLAGAPVSVSVTATSVSPLTYQWQKYGIDIPGATNATFALSSPAHADSGIYRVKVTNQAGTITSGYAQVVVADPVPPVFFVNPESATAIIGNARGFWANAKGALPITYQWTKDGADIAGATSRYYQINPLQSGDAASYQCRATNPYGSSLSTAAVLTLISSEPALNIAAQTMNAALGPSFADLNPGASDDRTLMYKPDSVPNDVSFSNNSNPYEIPYYSVEQDGVTGDDDYWSVSGQCCYVPDDAVNGSGLDRIFTFAYYNHVWSTSPRLNGGISDARPDWQVWQYQGYGYIELKNPVAETRNYATLANEALVIWESGFLSIHGTSTSRTGDDYPLKGVQFPTGKKLTDIALTSSNELTLIAVQDTNTGTGQIAVLMNEGKYLPQHTMQRMGLINQGSWSDFKLLGYIDLPFAHPDRIAAASNAKWGGPSSTQTADNQPRTMGQIDPSIPGDRSAMYDGQLAYMLMVGTKGYAIVSSRTDNKVCIVDLAPVIAYIRDSWLLDFDNTNAGRTAGTWPKTFAEMPSIAPTIAWQATMTKPCAVLAGLDIDRWTPDRWKAHVAQEDGTVHIIDTSSLMSRWDWEINSGSISDMGTFQVGRNPTHMCFVRFAPYPLPLLPYDNAGNQRGSDAVNNVFHCACRGDRRIDSCVTYGGSGQVYASWKDQRMEDPVNVDVADRGNIVEVADFKGKKVIAYQIGGMNERDPSHAWGAVGPYHGPGPDQTDSMQAGGELLVPGHPFDISQANVN